MSSAAKSTRVDVLNRRARLEHVDLKIDGRIALVTGASTGIGAAVAQRLSREGCKLALIARDRGKLDAAKASLTGPYADQTILCECDVRLADAVNAAIRTTMQGFGGVDILVNNAGGLTTEDLLSFESLDDEQFLATYVFNVLSAVRFIRGVLPGMRRRGWGRIVNVSSESGVQPDATGADYNAAKAALNAISKTLSKVYAAEGVLINVVSPAFTMTELVREHINRIAQATGKSFADATQAVLTNFRPNIALRRPGQAHETADVVAFLASDCAAFVNGSIFRVDGGSVACV
jgi:3-oxoacyl-[acyl-carrier protein] reductase